jgi:CysZ protein
VAYFEGLGFLAKTPAVWHHAVVPMIVAMALFGLASALGLWGAVRAEGALLGAHSGGWATAGHWALLVVFGALGLVVALVVSLSLAQPLSGWALDGLVRGQEQALGLPPRPEEPLVASTLRSLRVTFVGLALGLPVLALLALLGFLVPPAVLVTVPLKVLVGALIIAWDFLDYPFGLRGVGVRGRLRWIGQHFGAVLGFGLAAMLVLVVPCVSLLVLPVGVLGATRLLASAEPR